MAASDFLIFFIRCKRKTLFWPFFLAYKVNFDYKISRRCNACEALQFLEGEGFFSQADIAIQPPGDVLKSEEDSGD